MSEQQKRTPPQITDATGLAVAANVRRLRERRGLSTYQLSGDLGRAGRPISPSAIAKVERGERRVDVGDLMALSVALNVSPSALLLPLDDSPESTVEVTGAGSVPADVAWDWADGKRPLQLPEGDIGTAMFEYMLYSRPPGRRLPSSNDVAYVIPKLRELGFPIDKWMRDQGLIEPPDGDDG